ncbi:GDSL-type esterase/lipase family protein [Adhaeribacter aquaticus]|uniref:GDSL-type esterase/lipase family protein n=1 Tax=Adhaeribacter aquaticus TaxID=299567 RepID=UPI000426FD12|nr:GDSL-type esterase/lipase family protein [Adhaeribacter aquaticus]
MLSLTTAIDYVKGGSHSKRISKEYILVASLTLNFLLIGFGVYKIWHNRYLTIKSASLQVTRHQYRTNIFNALPVTPHQIIFLGDSHTEWFELAEILGNAAIKNRGIGNDRTSDVLTRLNTIIESKPTKLFIQIGINDIITGVPQQKTIANLESIFSTIRKSSPSTTMYLQSILPTGPERNYQEQITQLNQVYKNLSKKYSLTFVNLYPSFSNKNGLKKEFDSGDHIHLNGAGYLKWGEIIRPYL